jgi:hypothetical protein
MSTNTRSKRTGVMGLCAPSLHARPTNQTATRTKQSSCTAQSRLDVLSTVLTDPFLVGLMCGLRQRKKLSRSSVSKGSAVNSILEQAFVVLFEVHVGRDDLKVASCVTAASGERQDMIHVELDSESFLKCWDLRVDRSDGRIASMCEKLLRAHRTRPRGVWVEIFHGRKPAEARIHFKNIEDFFHWVFAHGGYFSI